MDKARDTTKEEAENTAETMGALFQGFIQNLRSLLVVYQLGETEDILSNITYTLAPKHGLGKHSGVLGRFTMMTEISNC